MRALVLLLAAGCFGQPVRDDCQVRCGEGAACPDDYLCGADLFCHPSDLDTPRDCAAAVDGGEAELVPCDTVEECGGGDAVCRCGLCAAPDASCTPSGLRFVTTSPVAGPCAAGATGVGAGSSHSCAVTSDGHAFCWGANCDGQLGNPSAPIGPSRCDAQTGSSVPVPVEGAGGPLTDLGDITAGLGSTCALQADTTVLCWGDDQVGQLGRGAEGDFSVDPDLVLSDRGSLTGIAALELGSTHVCAASTAGDGWCWGNNAQGQLGIDDWSGPLDSRPIAMRVDTAVGFASVSSGGSHSCAVVEGDRAKCWGRNHVGQLGSSVAEDPASQPLPVDVLRESDEMPLQRVTRIGAGTSSTCAATGSPDELWCWGGNESHVLGDDTCPECPDGTDAWLARRVSLDPGSPVARVGVGARHACALLEGGDLWCWGGNEDSQIGVASGEPWLPPTRVMEGVVDVAVGAYHTCAIGGAGQVLCWGRNVWGELGNGSRQVADEPTPVEEMCP